MAFGADPLTRTRTQISGEKYLGLKRAQRRLNQAWRMWCEANRQSTAVMRLGRPLTEIEIDMGLAGFHSRRWHGQRYCSSWSAGNTRRPRLYAHGLADIAEVVVSLLLRLALGQVPPGARRGAGPHGGDPDGDARPWTNCSPSRPHGDEAAGGGGGRERPGREFVVALVPAGDRAAGEQPISGG